MCLAWLSKDACEVEVEFIGVGQSDEEGWWGAAGDALGVLYTIISHSSINLKMLQRYLDIINRCLIARLSLRLVAVRRVSIGRDP